MRRASITSPKACRTVRFYQPTARGLEAKIAEKLAQLRELDAAARKKTEPQRRRERRENRVDTECHGCRGLCLPGR